MQHLAVEPVELVPVEAGTGAVDPIKIKHRSGLLEGKPLPHALGWRPAQQGHVIGQGFGPVTQIAEVTHGGDPIALGEFLALLIEDQGSVGKHGLLQPQGFVEQQLLGGVGDVVFAANHMADRHGGIVNDHHQVVERITDLIGRCTPGDHHIAA